MRTWLNLSSSLLTLISKLLSSVTFSFSDDGLLYMQPTKSLSLSFKFILIHTCSRAEENNMRNALQIAASAYNALDAGGLIADSVTYMSMIRVILNLMNDSEGKVQALTALFKKCCEGGFLNQHMINILAQNTSEDEFQSITGMARPGGIDALQIESLPSEWRQNATSQRKN